MEYHFCSPSLEGGIPLVLLLDTLSCLGVLGVEFPFCIEEGTVGMASTVLVAWLLGTAGCWSTGDSSGIYGSPVVGWGSVETEFWLTLPWLDEVAVSPEALSSSWNLNHVGVGFSALLTYDSFFTLPRIRILEPYILSCLEWQCFNSILEIFGISVELAFFLRYEFSLLADPVIHHL